MANVVVPGAKNVADVAAIASLMDEVVAVDTLALNVAGAICHPRVTALLPLNCNWKWHCGSPWYPLIKLRRQRRAEDWSSLCR